MTGFDQLSPRPLAIAAVGVAGATVALVPQHAVSVARVLVALLALVAVGVLVRAVLPAAGKPALGPTESPFTVPRREPTRREDPAGLGVVRTALLTDPIRRDVRVPGAIAARLATAIAVALDRAGVDQRDPAHMAAVRARVAPATWAIVEADLTRAHPFTSRAAGREATATAGVVDTVLDDVDALAAPTHPSAAPDPGPRGAP